MRGKKYFIFLILSVTGFLLISWLWPQGGQLPILDKLDSFQLDDVHGGKYQSTNEKIKLVTFFYTNCPDVCPLTMVDYKELQEVLKNEGYFGKTVELVAISIDPENDTPSIIKNYAASFDADPTGWKWLRGTPQQTKKIADKLKMNYQKLEGDFFSHSITMYLIDEEDQIRALYDMASSTKTVEKEKIIEDIKLLAQDK